MNTKVFTVEHFTIEQLINDIKKLEYNEKSIPPLVIFKTISGLYTVNWKNYPTVIVNKQILKVIDELIIKKFPK
jgi:hypothetical protein